MFYNCRMTWKGRWPRERAQTTRLASFGPLVSFFLNISSFFYYSLLYLDYICITNKRDTTLSPTDHPSPPIFLPPPWPCLPEQLEIATSFFNFFTIILIIQQLFPVCGSFFCSFHVLYRIVLFLFYFIHNTVYFYICFFKLILVTVSLAALCAESPTLINKHIFITSWWYNFKKRRFEI